MGKGKFSKLDLYRVLSDIPLDIEGSNISCTGWMPSESDRKWIDEDTCNKAVLEFKKRNEKVLFDNVELAFDSCDCGDVYGCPHGSYVYEIRVTDENKTHELDIDDSGIIAFYDGRQTMIPEKGCTVYDFYRMCELVGIELKLSAYVISLLSAITKF